MADFVRGEAILEVQMLTYRNPTGTNTYNGELHSCDNRYIHFGNTWQCDTLFMICAKKTSG